MEEDSKFGSVVKWGLGAVGLGGIAAVVTFDNKKHGILVALAILVLFLIVFGSYYLWRRMRARRQSKMFSSAIEAQTGAAPKSISDPNQRAALDKLRQKFQTGMQEFKNRGKDIYKLPWYVIIGESGSGKSEAIRHSGVEFPPGLQDEMQGSGGTVNMDWWFTNRAIILDTAGSMIFREQQAGASPEWGEFLRLLKKSRPQCPINGLFLVLSIESLINDSADKIAEKASKLAQQLQLIQRTLDVRFPVYLLVTKADLLTGFRDFFDNIEDPLLQHQMFGWSNPDPLDSNLRADLVEQHLKSVADRLRRRRLALLLRESASSSGRLGDTTYFSASAMPLGGRGGQRKLDDMDAMFALPESIMRLVPRLRRYLEVVFVAGEWSAKPVFLRGIYFTSSMREGKALDEAMALATGLSVDQLPEDRSWEKNRAFFLRDLFVEKVFRESGLVTRATNTIQLLRKRQFAIFGTAGVAMLLLVVFAGFGYRNLKRSVLSEATEWETGAGGWTQDNSWSPPIVVSGGADSYQFTYAGTNLTVPAAAPRLSVAAYQQRLKTLASRDLEVSWIFKPFSWMGLSNVKNRDQAQRILFEHGVLQPLVIQTRNKMQGRDLSVSDAKAVDRHREALLSLIQLETDKYATNRGNISGSNAAVKYLNAFISYLTDGTTLLADTNLVDVFTWTYSKGGSGDGKWPPQYLLGGNSLSNNPAIMKGLHWVHIANSNSVTRIEKEELPRLNQLADDLKNYRDLENQWLSNSGDACGDALIDLSKAMEKVRTSRSDLLKVATDIERPVTNIASCYFQLAEAASTVSAGSFSSIISGLPESVKTEAGGLLAEIRKQLSTFNREAARGVNRDFVARSNYIADLDLSCLAVSPSNAASVFESRSLLYSKACNLASESAAADENSIGDKWDKYERLTTSAADFKKELTEYNGPYAKRVQSSCERIAGQAEMQLKEKYVENYVQFTIQKLEKLATDVCSFRDVTNAIPWLEKVKNDLSQSAKLKEQAVKLDRIKSPLEQAQKRIAQNYVKCAFNTLKPKLKFPVLLSSTEAFDEAGLKEVKNMLNRLAAELAEPVWQTLPGSEETLTPLLASVKNFQNLVNSLIKPDDTLAEMEILFVPPAIWNEEAGIPRYAKLFVNGVEKKISSPRPGDLSSCAAPTPITTKIPADCAIRIEFFSELDRKNKTATLGSENWMLPRLIESDQAEQINNGKEWKLKTRVTIDGSSRTLEAFQIRLDNPLPKKTEWPK